MYVEFDSLPDSSKVWIYQASGFMDDSMTNKIFAEARNFIQSWTAHQADLKASVKVFDNLFLVFAVDESYNDASGCSIDKKVHFVKSLEIHTGLNFFDRMKIAYLDNGTIGLENMNKFSSLIDSGKVKDNTIIFNNLVSTKGEFIASWKTPFAKSWLVNVI